MYLFRAPRATSAAFRQLGGGCRGTLRGVTGQPRRQFHPGNGPHFGKRRGFITDSLAQDPRTKATGTLIDVLAQAPVLNLLGRPMPKP